MKTSPQLWSSSYLKTFFFGFYWILLLIFWPLHVCVCPQMFVPSMFTYCFMFATFLLQARSQICDVHMYELSLDPHTRTSYREWLSKYNCLSLIQKLSSNNSDTPSPVNTEMMLWLIYVPYINNHRCCEFLCAMIWPCPKDSFASSLCSCNLSTPS